MLKKLIKYFIKSVYTQIISLNNHKSIRIFTNYFNTFVKIISLIMIMLTITISLFSISKELMQRPYHVLAYVTDNSQLNPQQTWNKYRSIFYKLQTNDLTPHFLAAMVYTLSKGVNWQRLGWHFKIDKLPANLLQVKNDNFGVMSMSYKQFKRSSSFCIADHQVITKKPWYIMGGCRFNMFKTRASAYDSIELAASNMQHMIDINIIQKKLDKSDDFIKNYGAIFHQCGTNYAQKYLKSNGSLTGIHSCKNIQIKNYLAEIKKFESLFSGIVNHEIASSYQKQQKMEKLYAINTNNKKISD